MSGQTNFQEKTSPELVELFNGMVEKVHALGRGSQFKAVQRFSDHAAAVRRCELLTTILKTAEENPNPDGPVQETEGEKKSRALRENTSKGDIPEEESEVAKATSKKAGAKAAKPAKAARPAAADKPAKAPKAAKPAGEKPAKGERRKYNDGPFYMNRPDSNREKASAFLLKNEGKLMKMNAIFKAVYGTDATDGIGPLAMVIGGLQKDIEKFDIPYTLKREKNDAGEFTYGLFKGKK